MMNKKSDNGWILCPSKSFPGKYYYFNVINGEAVWSLSEVDKTSLNLDSTTRRVIDNVHMYPEPNTPPADVSFNTTNAYYTFNSQPKEPFNCNLQTLPMYGQPMFPKYMPNECMMGYMLPMPPVFVTNKPETRKRVSDRITQTSDSCRDIFVQSCSIPLSKRFGYFQDNEHTKTFENKGISNTNNVNWWNTKWSFNNFGVPQRRILNTNVNNQNIHKVGTSENDLPYQRINNQDTLIKNKVFNHPVLTTSKKNDEITINENKLSMKPECLGKTENNVYVTLKKRLTQSTDINSCQKNATQFIFKENQVQASKGIRAFQNLALNAQSKFLTETENELNDNVGGTQRALEKNDLRYILQAKRKKLEHNNWILDEKETMVDDDNNIHNDNATVIKQNFDPKNVQEKKIVSNGEDGHVQIGENIANSPIVLDISYLKSLSNMYQKTDPWYIVIDMGVLLDEFEFIDDFVKEDITCRVLIPNSVQTYLQTISIGKYADRSRVISARKAIRRLATPRPHMITQSLVMVNTANSSVDGIIDCCLQVLQRNHVVLLTTDTDLYYKGLSFGIYTFKVDEVITSIANQPKVSFNIEKIDNVNQKSENFIPYVVINSNNLSINEGDVFKVPTSDSKNRETVTKINNRCDASTSPINFEKSSHKTVAHIESDSKIENNIQKISFMEDKDENTNDKVSKDVFNANRELDFKIKKVIVKPNYSDNYTKQFSQPIQNFKLESQNRTFYKYSPNRNGIGSENLEKVTSTSEFKTELESRQILNRANKPQPTNTRNCHKLKINVYTIDGILKAFHVNSPTLKQRINTRLDEWVCCYQQIMEECLTDVLMNNTASLANSLKAPWALSEAVICVKQLFSHNTSIKTVADYLYSTLSNHCDKNDKLNRNVMPADFMKLLGCSILLVDCLKSILPHSDQVQESKESLNILLEHIQDPTMDTDLPTNFTSIPHIDIENMECFNKNNSSKQPKEIIEYLKQHFPAWKDYEEGHVSPEQAHQHNDNTFHCSIKEPIRTFGKNLHAVKIDNYKGITVENVLIDKTPKFNYHTSISDEEVPQKMDTIHKEDKKVNRYLNNNYIDTDVDKSPMNAIGNKRDETEIIRSGNFNHGVEGKISNHKELFDLNDFENESILSKYTDNEYENVKKCHYSFNDYERIASFNENFTENVFENDYNEIFLSDGALMSQDGGFKCNNDTRDSLLGTRANGKIADVNDRIVINTNDESTNDSGFENECVQTCSFIKAFLTEMGGSFKVIYSFIDESIRKILCDELQQEMKKNVHDKANESQLHVSDIIGKLKQIIEREAAETTKLKSLIINAGVEALTDKRITKYRQVVMKCLEQAQLLEGALKTMLALTNEHCDISMLNDNEVNCDITYFNIFE